ncbi:hypothetical protein BGZ73_000419 [Actinomortierella ambigua]|nr:hypothetical protein BGZ73_000419 [Actinomortierella ambigua]
MKLLSLLAIACVAAFPLADAAGVLIQHKEGIAIPGKYIVKLKENVAGSNSFEDTINEILRRHRSNNNSGLVRRSKLPKITERFEALNAFAIEDSEDDLQELLNLDQVEYIEQDVKVQLFAPTTTTTRVPPQSTTTPPVPDQPTPTPIDPTNIPNWGLRRITQRNRVSQQCNHENCGPIKSLGRNGAGITVYVIDSGIKLDHPEFEGRARHGKNVMEGSPDTDEYSHGTHVASTIGGRFAGVAREVSLVSVKMVDKKGWSSSSHIASAINWVRQDARGKRAVVNMSLGIIGLSRAINDASRALVKADVVVIASAGNSPNIGACFQSPAGATGVFTVAASNVSDSFTGFSSYGMCVEMIAPGQDIYGASIDPTQSYIPGSGTSMAAPFVAGAAAVYMSNDHNLRTPEQVYNKLMRTATRNKISGPLRGTPNRLLYLS